MWEGRKVWAYWNPSFHIQLSSLGLFHTPSAPTTPGPQGSPWEMTDGCKITGTVLPGLLLSSEIHLCGLESLMAVTSLFIDMAGNAPFLSAVGAVCLPGGSRGTNIFFHLVPFSGCLHSLAHGHTCPSSEPAIEEQFLLILISLTSSSSSFFL